MLTIGVLADTHVPRRARDLPASVYRRLEAVDLILHAGDVLVAEVLERLAQLAPVHAVLGNNDVATLGGTLPATRELVLHGHRLGLVHDSGAREGRERRMRRRFPAADCVVFGHSHIPWCARAEDGFLLFNTGSPTDKRRQPAATMGLLRVEAPGAPIQAEIVPI